MSQLVLPADTVRFYNDGPDFPTTLLLQEAGVSARLLLRRRRRGEVEAARRRSAGIALGHSARDSAAGRGARAVVRNARQPGHGLRADRLPRLPRRFRRLGESEWTAERFVAAFVTEVPQTKAEVVATASGDDFSARKAMRLLREAENLGLVHRWKFGSTTPVQFAIAIQHNAC